MALSIKSDRADRLARELAALTGETLTETVERSLEDRLSAERHRRRRVPDLDTIVARFAQLPVLDDRSADEIIGYDEHGLAS